MAMFRNVNLAPIDASGFERAGAAYGQMFQNLGNTIAQNVETKRLKKEEKQRNQATANFILKNKGIAQSLFGESVNLNDPDEVAEATKQLAKADPRAVAALLQSLSTSQAQDQDRRAGIELQGRALDIQEEGNIFDRELRLSELGLAGRKQDFFEKSTEDQLALEKEKLQMGKEQLAIEGRLTDAQIDQISASTAKTLSDITFDEKNYALAKSAEERASLVANHSMEISDAQLRNESRRLNLDSKNFKARNALAKQDIRLKAKQMAIEKVLAEKRIKQGSAQFAKQYELEEKKLTQQLNNSLRQHNIEKKKLENATKALEQAGENNASLRKYRKSQSDYYKHLSTKGNDLPTSEFLYSLEQGNFTGEQKEKLMQARARHLAGAKEMTNLEIVKRYEEYKPNGALSIADMSSLLLGYQESKAAGKPFKPTGMEAEVKELKGGGYMMTIHKKTSSGKVTITQPITSDNLGMIDDYRRVTNLTLGGVSRGTEGVAMPNQGGGSLGSSEVQDRIFNYMDTLFTEDDDKDEN